MRAVAAVPALAGVLLGAGCDRSQPASVSGGAKVRRVVCSFGPMFLFTRNVVGTAPGVTVELMLPNVAGCPHDYELSLADTKRIAGADVIVLSGGIEAFAGETLRKINPEARQIEAWAGCQLLSEHEHEAEHEHASAAEADHAHSHADDNPHVWVSPIEAARQVKNIAEGLAQALPEHADTFRANAAAYTKRLDALAQEFATAAKSMRRKQIVTTHGAFDYLARDLGLEVVATVQVDGRSEPGGRRMAQIVQIIRASGAAAVFTEPQLAGRGIAESIAQEAGVPIRTLDPITTVTAHAPADDYEVRMRANLRTLAEVLQ